MLYEKVEMRDLGGAALNLRMNARTTQKDHPPK